MSSLLPWPAGSRALWALSVLLALLAMSAFWPGPVAQAATMTFAPAFSPFSAPFSGTSTGVRSATRLATLRQTDAISRSKLRSPASRV